MTKKNIIYNTKHVIQSTINDTYFLHFSQLYILSPGNRTDLVIPLKIKVSYCIFFFGSAILWLCRMLILQHSNTKLTFFSLCSRINSWCLPCLKYPLLSLFSNLKAYLKKISFPDFTDCLLYIPARWWTHKNSGKS